MGLKNIDLIKCLQSKTFTCKENNKYKFKVNYLSFTFGYKDDVYFHATLIDQDQYEHRAIIKAVEHSESLLNKVVIIKPEDWVLFKTYKTNCSDYIDKNNSLSWS